MRFQTPGVSGTGGRILAASSVCTIVALTLVMATSQASSVADCEEVEGTIRERQIPGVDPLQTRGRMGGDIHGDYAFELTAAVPSQTPDVLHFDGRSEVETEDGTLFFSDAGAVSTFGRGNLAYVSTITGGSAELEGATGQLLVRGFFNFATGRGKAEYVGEVCASEDGS